MSDDLPSDPPHAAAETGAADPAAELVALRNTAAKVAREDSDSGGQCGSDVLNGLLRLADARRLFSRHGREPVEAALIAGIREIHPDYEMPLDRRASWRKHAITASVLARKTYQPVQFVLPGLIPEGVTILAGKPKAGKSWLALELCLAVAGDRCTIGNLKPVHGDVLYLALEDSQLRLQRRVERLLAPVGAPWPERLTLATHWQRFANHGRYDVDGWCSSVPAPRLIVVDTLAKIRPAANGRGPHGIDDETAAGLRRLVDERGVAVLVIQHTGRTDAEAIFDSVGLSGAADTILALARNSAGWVLHARGRDIDECEMAVQFDKATGRWTLLGPAADLRQSHERRRILEVLAATGDEPLAVKDIMRAAGMCNRNAADLMLGRMVAAGEIARATRGRYLLATDRRQNGATDANGAQGADTTAESGNLSNLSGFCASGDMPVAS